MPRIKRRWLTLASRSQMISTAPEMNSRARTIFRNMASSIRPKSRRPSHVPARRNGRPITNSLIVSGVTVPLAPSQRTLIRKMQTGLTTPRNGSAIAGSGALLGDNRCRRRPVETSDQIVRSALLLTNLRYGKRSRSEHISFTSLTLFSIHAAGGYTNNANWHSPDNFRSRPCIDHGERNRRPHSVVADSGSEQPRPGRHHQRTDRFHGRKGTRHHHHRSARRAYRDPDVICSA